MTAGVRVLRSRLEEWLDPERVYAHLVAGRPHHVWRDAGIDAATGTSFLGWPGEPAGVVTATSSGSVLIGGLPAGDEDAGGRPDDAFGRLTAIMRNRLEERPARSGHLGWWGWIGYELCCSALGVPLAGGGGAPAAVQLFVDRGLVFDHAMRTVTVVVLGSAPDARAWLASTTADLARGVPEPPPIAPRPAVRAEWRHEREAYLERIDACGAAIRAGDAYQLCLTDAVVLRGAAPVDPVDTIRRLRRAAPAPEAGVVRSGDHHLISASPERFLEVDVDRRASTSPIKGTRRRDADPEADARLADELRTDEKERAENLMIVDLMRNDLSRVAAVGGVEVAGLFEVETYASVHQLVSTVRAELEVDAVAALHALVPPGSMTGAPKRSAVQHLRELEGGPRGAYAGIWGRCSTDGSADLAVVIRSIELRGGVAVVGAGGGITAMSRPAAEWDEVLLKAGPLIDAVGEPAP